MTLCNYRYEYTDPKGRLKVDTCTKKSSCPICGRCCDNQINPSLGCHCPGHRMVLSQFLLPNPNAPDAEGNKAQP